MQITHSVYVHMADVPVGIVYQRIGQKNVDANTASSYFQVQTFGDSFSMSLSNQFMLVYLDTQCLWWDVEWMKLHEMYQAIKWKHFRVTGHLCREFTIEPIIMAL